MKQLFLSIFFIVFVISVISNTGKQFDNSKILIKKAQTEQALKLLDSMTIEEKIGQLLMVNGYSNKMNDFEKLSGLIQNYHIGGVLFFQGTPSRQAIITNKLQSISKIPLFIAMDAEWGISMRLDSVINFPRQMTLGAIQDNKLIYKMGQEVAYQCQRLGVHINFAPVIDINTNPKNQVIHLRSFGENRELVSQKGISYMMGMQDHRIMAVAKHFPGHGDTDIDSHKDLPVINKSIEDLKHNELYPFYKLIKKGIEGIMVAHLYVPAIDGKNKLPTSISHRAIHDLLLNDMGFTGLIFTDALNMQGVARDYKSGDKEIKALEAGNDILLFPNDVEKAVNAIKNAVLTGVLSEDIINAKVKKVLLSKIEHGLFEQEEVELKNLIEDLNNSRIRFLKRVLAEHSLCLIKNEKDLIPLTKLSNKNIAAINFGGDTQSLFHDYLNLYDDINTYVYPSSCNYEKLNQLEKETHEYNTLIISLFDVAKYNVRNFNLDPRVIHFINSQSEKKNIILVNFGSPYALKYFDKKYAILQVGEQDEAFQQAAAQAIFGGIPISGKLPVSVGEFIPYGSGIYIKDPIRLKYVDPQEVNFSIHAIDSIEKIIAESISNEETPGCQVLIAKDGKVFYHKSFGYHTYDNQVAVQNTDIYDVASITKIAATMLPLMKLYEEDQISLDDTLGKYVKRSSQYVYGKALIRNMLMHQAGFKPWIAFYKNTLDDSKNQMDFYYSDEKSEIYSINANKGLYVNNAIIDSIWEIIYHTEVKEQGEYAYSDLDFMFLKKIIENSIDEAFDKLLKRTYYIPLGMNNTGFNPYEWFNISSIPPTEVENYFRFDTVQAYVHDPAAALLGGIEGHAGLFSNANDLAKLLQMFINEGEYGGEKYFHSSTIDTFTTKSSDVSRRALGFDKPEMDSFKSYNPTSKNTPASAYGHTGFTGTCAWADPENDIIYIFLSNRTFPSSENKKLWHSNTRAKIQELIYSEILK